MKKLYDMQINEINNIVVSLHPVQRNEIISEYQIFIKLIILWYLLKSAFRLILTWITGK
jgi:hypothetical protein